MKNRQAQLRQGWELKRLGDVCVFGNGLWSGKKPPFQRVGVIRNTNFTNDGRLDDADIVYLEVEKSQFEKRKLQYGDIILEKSGGGPKQPVGRVIIFDKKEGDFSFSNFTSVIRISDPKIFDFNYLHRFLFFSYISGKTEKMQSYSTGIRNLKFDEYKNIVIPIPPLKEQQRIVSILDETFASIAKAKANAEQNLKNTKELFESYLHSVFANKGEGWVMVKLSELALNISDGDHMPPPKTKSGIPFITISNINKENYQIDFSDTFTVSQEYFQKLKKNRKPRKGDLLYTVTGSYGIPVLIETNKDFCFQRHIGLIRPKENINSKWLFYWVLSPQALAQANDKATGTAQKTVSLNVLRNFNVPKMTIIQQQSIVQKVDALSTECKKLKSIYQQKINDLEELKKSILQKAFNSEL
ncbi:MAG: restriction endonuclease subunit S [Bacteroidetes bacterium]|nr:restriction endonuclease subunit S [Bacteroidota bacterium]